MIDDDWALAREHMVRVQIQGRGVRDPRVLEALRSVPRERFLAPEQRSRAYTDHALPIGHHQTISQPYMVAIMTEALGLAGTERVLEIGTGSGYQTAVLARLAAEVWTVERVPALAEVAGAVLDELGLEWVHLRIGDGSLGLPDAAPFQGILVTAAAPAPPPPLLHQLDADGGRLVIPVGDRDLQHVVRIERHGTEYRWSRSVGCRFVPLLGAEGWAD